MTMRTEPITRSTAKPIAVTAIMFAAIAVVALNTWLAFRSVESLLDSESWVQHTLKVINQVERIMSSAKDAETGSRGYLITNDRTYLEPYTAAVKDIPEELDGFQTLTSDNASQQQRIAEMRAVLALRLGRLARGVALVADHAPADQLQQMVKSGTGKQEMDHLRSIADQMDQEEERLLALRMAAAKSSSLRARFTIAFASALDLVLLVLAFRFIVQERQRRLQMERAGRQLAEAHAQTEAKAAEVLILNLELEERVRLRTRELETTNKELEAFSYSVSHDLRAPLRTIDGFSLALEEDYAEAVDAVGKDYIRRVRSSVQRMGQLIDALLQLSRITRAELTREQFDMSELAGSVMAELQDGDVREVEQGAEREVESDDPRPRRQAIDFRVQPGLEADADPRLLRVALENLLGNAVKFSSKIAEPVIEFGWDPAAMAWFVRDNGAGFDMFYADKLFNAFNRLHGDKDFKGSGIGLATVARVIRRHHGRIWADSVVGRGATFWFTLG